jgi:hypothetical protein
MRALPRAHQQFSKLGGEIAHAASLPRSTWLPDWVSCGAMTNSDEAMRLLSDHMIQLATESLGHGSSSPEEPAATKAANALVEEFLKLAASLRLKVQQLANMDARWMINDGARSAFVESSEGRIFVGGRNPNDANPLEVGWNAITQQFEGMECEPGPEPEFRRSKRSAMAVLAHAVIARLAVK